MCADSDLCIRASSRAAHEHTACFTYVASSSALSAFLLPLSSLSIFTPPPAGKPIVTPAWAEAANTAHSLTAPSAAAASYLLVDRYS